MEIPEYDNEFFCIASINQMNLSAVISSYIYKPGKYTSLYEFPNAVNVEDGIAIEIVDEYQISRSRAREYNIKIHNVIKKMHGCNFLILAGLTVEQKSYLTFLDKYNTIEIQCISDVENKLRPLVSKSKTRLVKIEDAVKSLFSACIRGELLKIDEEALYSDYKGDQKNEGLIVIENRDRCSTVIAINYALSINADIEIISVPKIKNNEVNDLIKDWKSNVENAFNNLSALIYPTIEHIKFDLYKYATFFTTEIPYSLILKNSISFTHVNVDVNPDFFIFNNIYNESFEQFSTALIFSPIEFEDEETTFIINQLEKKNFYLQKLIGKEASAINLDFHISEFPFDLLHICSHGGEISGFNTTETYIDRNGDEHTIEYDEVVTFSPEQGKELIKVTTSMIWRVFDGMDWDSDEFKQKAYPQYIFTDMLNSIKSNKNKNRIKIESIYGSSSIKCYDFNFQAMFNLIASGLSPVIFNNTCWSWSNISIPFIASGARCYIGTLWAVKNEDAKTFAESFYEELNDQMISEVVFNSQKKLIGSESENTYIVWGLHFSTLKPGASIDENKIKIAKELLKSIYNWRSNLVNLPDGKIKNDINSRIQWIAKLVSKDFQKEAHRIMLNTEKK